MITVYYTPGFIRQYDKLPESLKTEAKEKIELFKHNQRHTFLKTHKLKGNMSGYYSFSVNYQYRIVFEYDSKTTVALLAIGDHDVYK
jgi:addiction module RelE/StbE family toxin